MNHQFYLTPAAGKMLIAMGIARRPDVREALKDAKILVIGGTTNAYVANALLAEIGSDERVGFPEFHRGIVIPRGAKAEKAEFRGDLLIDRGTASFTDDLAAACESLKAGDIVFKGANALYLPTMTAGVLIGHMVTGGTVIEATKAVISRRAKLIMPVGVEKRVDRPLNELMELCNEPGGSGLRLFQAPGEVFTEIEAAMILTGSELEIVAAGGVNGAEGGVYFDARGGDLDALKEIVREVSGEEHVRV